MPTPRPIGQASLCLLLVGCPVGWDPEPPVASFELVGRHEPLACVACHPTTGPLRALPTACASCHEEVRPLGHYDGDCGQCHTPFGWDDIVVDHSFFPLTFAHDLPCEGCHVSGFSGLDPTCGSCHEAARPPGHFLGQDCEPCHVPTTWSDGSIDHDPLFPLPHHGVNACTSCHLVPDDFGAFSCTSCHEHAKGGTDAEHREIPGYSYESGACLRCHPNGGGD